MALHVNRKKQNETRPAGEWTGLGEFRDTVKNGCEIVGFPFFFNEQYQETLFFFFINTSVEFILSEKK